jgi:hypothetical protein
VIRTQGRQSRLTRATLSACLCVTLHCGPGATTKPISVKPSRVDQGKGVVPTCDREGNVLILDVKADCRVTMQKQITVEDVILDEIIHDTAAKSGSNVPDFPNCVRLSIDDLSASERLLTVTLSGICSDGETRAGGAHECSIGRTRGDEKMCR